MLGEEVIAYYGDAGDGAELFEKSKLVRCKDCRFRRVEDDDMVCGFEYGLGGSVRPNLDFCSYGERSEE